MSTHYDLAIIGTGSGNSIVDERFAGPPRRHPREGHVRRHLPERRLHPHQDVRLPRRRRPLRGAGRRRSASRPGSTGSAGPRSATGSSARIDPISIGGRGLAGRRERAQRHALRGARPLRRRPHPRHRHGRDRSRPTRSCIAAGARPVVPDIEGLDDVGFHTSDTVMRLDALPAPDADPRRRLRGRGVRARLRLVRHPCHDREPVVRGCCAPRTTRSRAAFTEIAQQPLGRAARHHGRPRSRRTTAGSRAQLSDGSTVEVDVVLVAAGRRSNADGLDLDRDRRRASTRTASSSSTSTSAPASRASGRSATSPTTSSSSTSRTSRRGWSSTTCCTPTT